MILKNSSFKFHNVSLISFCFPHNRKLQVFNILAAIYFLLRSKLKDIIQTRFLH